MFQGVFDVLLVKKLFLTCVLKSTADSTFLILFGISFYTLAPLYEKLFLVISSFGIGTCRSFIDLCLFVPCFPAFFDLLISLGQ